MENIFSSKMVSKSDGELLSIVKQRDQYDDRALLAAIYELDKRELSDNLTNSLKAEIELCEEKKVENRKIKTEGPLIPKFLIFAISFLLTPLIGSIFLSINVANLKRIKEIGFIVGFGVSYTIISIVIFHFTNYYFGSVIIVNALGAAIISETLWKKYMKPTVLNAEQDKNK